MSSRDAMEYIEEAYEYLNQAIKAVENESLDEAISLMEDAQSCLL